MWIISLAKHKDTTVDDNGFFAWQVLCRCLCLYGLFATCATDSLGVIDLFSAVFCYESSILENHRQEA